MSNKTVTDSEYVPFFTAFLMFLIAALMVFIMVMAHHIATTPRVDSYETGVEVGRQMILEAIEGEPGYCAGAITVE